MSLFVSFDNYILNIIKGFRFAPFDFLMPILTSLCNNAEVWIFICILLLFFKKTRKTAFVVAVALFFALIFGNLLLKPLIARLRPCDVDGLFPLLIKRPFDYSFPSGHSFSSFAAATAIFLNNKKYGVLALILAFLIAFSRLYLGVHYPTDVICGIIFGILSAVFANFIVNWLYIHNKRLVSLWNMLKQKQ